MSVGDDAAIPPPDECDLCGHAAPDQCPKCGGKYGYPSPPRPPCKHCLRGVPTEAVTPGEAVVIQDDGRIRLTVHAGFASNQIVITMAETTAGHVVAIAVNPSEARRMAEALAAKAAEVEESLAAFSRETA